MKNRKRIIIMILAVISIIIYLAYLYFGLILNPNPDKVTVVKFMGLTIVLLFAFALYGAWILFNIHYAETKKETITFLSKDKFTQLSFFLNCGETEAKILSAILNAEGCEFYAKLTEDDNILLIVKDKNDDEICNTIISNYLYFTNHFKQKEN